MAAARLLSVVEVARDMRLAARGVTAHATIPFLAKGRPPAERQHYSEIFLPRPALGTEAVMLLGAFSLHKRFCAVKANIVGSLAEAPYATEDLGVSSQSWRAFDCGVRLTQPER